MLLDLALFFFLYNFAFGRQIIDLNVIAVSPYIAAFLIVFPVTFLTGFWLMNNVAFCGSPMKNRTKLSRYFLVICFNIGINYAGLKFLVEYLHFYPTPAKFIIMVVCTLFSYVSQRYFTFRHYTR
jgi:putative flippase GtrA